MRQIRLLKAFSMLPILYLATLSLSAQTFQTLGSFNNQVLFPRGLTQGTNGDFYSVSQLGEQNGWGAVLKIEQGHMEDLYNFCGLANCADGSYANGGLALGVDGNVYGTTFGGDGPSTVFKVSPNGALTTVYDFCSQQNCDDGTEPESGLNEGIDGNFYGATFSGGINGYGTIFELSASGAFRSLYSFCSLANCADGSNPQSPPILGTDGNIYGTTFHGGTHNLGSVFRLASGGQLKTLVSFSNSVKSGYEPELLIQATDGTLYGTTDGGGANQWGTIFKIDTSGKAGTLYNFCSLTNCSDGGNPSSLLQGPDGNLYGTTYNRGCSSGCGTIFQLTPQGALTTLYTFCAQTSCLDGYGPVALILATDGNLYGVTNSGGWAGKGTVFSLSMGFSPFVQPNPASGKVGRMIGIQGNNLLGTTSVTFNGVPATFTVVSNNLVKAAVPTGATTGPMQVTTSTGSLSTIANFIVR